ncbi:FlaA1/EpsC-like NDP-sugar epimerase [Homoserinimonas aerilata]|uniref:FlaA1/EpsC-like NDP-sugar epimerase n=1 Tax=Homoserinimonas aerilata TaxID=1162970 RepID=A0A542YKN0_9MICO|nr:FlaA1/EpsC-like NDP-sugar epimerase [Homoserinimonas aerilata]
MAVTEPELSAKGSEVKYAGGPMSRVWAKFLVDAFAWVVAIVFAVVLRYDLDVSKVVWEPIAVLCVAAVLVQLVVGWFVYLYRGRHPYGSFSEVLALVWVMVAGGVVLGLPVVLFGVHWQIPRSTVLLALPIAFVLMGAVRYLKRLVTEQLITPSAAAEKALVFGVGYLGGVIVKRMRTDSNSPYVPVGLIDDDPLKRNVWLHGVKVMGTRSDLGEVAARTGATVLVIAVGRADSVVFRAISDAADAAGLKVKVLPPLLQVLEGHSRLRDLRDISIEDLIGRHPVDTQMESIAGYLQGKKVLVTGAGGSIGSELCRQITKFRPAELIMLDRDETGLQSTQISISGHGLLDTKDVVLADIRDADALAKIFAERRPDVVFHAAALKHLPMLEQYPEEAWKTNVIGSLNVLQAAMNIGVDTFVNVSTDKAANPTSALGHSKRVAEKLTAWAAETTGKAYVSVRFGNVIGSRGSMLPTFTSLIEAGGPLTVTHPDATRYFMTIPEACQLVIQAGGIGRPAEVLILDMGEPIRILDVAERMIEMSGKDIAIVYTGLRHGEKLHEILVGDNESDNRPIHPKISHTTVKVITPERLNQQEWEARCRVEDGRTEVEPATLGGS